MKLTTFLLVAVYLHVSAIGLGQKVNISGKDMPLEKVFNMIKKQTGYVFFYDYSIFQGAKNVTVDIKDGGVDESIKVCLKDQSLDYNIVNKTIYVTKKGEQWAAPVNGEDPPTKIDVKGKVVNEKGEPVPGATVKIKGAKMASASTNEAGEFEIKEVESNASIVVSSVGYELWEVKLKGKVALSVLLHTKVSSLDETQVIAYGTTTQRFNVGSVTTVKAEDIAKQPVTNPLQALEGRVPGLVVTQSSGVPGATVQMQIRGQNSLNPSTGGIMPLDNPLVIIDGVPFSPQNSNINQLSSITAPGTSNVYNNIYGGMSPFNSINPSDIESIDVLRDADATAIYGSRGANGVILITTKKGKSGKISINGNVYTGQSRVAHTMPLMNTTQYLAMRHEAFNNDGITPNDIPGDPGYAPDLLNFDTTKNTDWKKYFIGGTAHVTDANASISGGTSNTQFLFGAGYHHESYIYPGGFADNRITMNSNFHHNSSNKRLIIDFSVNYSYDHNNSSNNINLLSAFTLPPDYPDLLKSNGDINWIYKGLDLGDYNLGLSTNPAAYLKQPYFIKTYDLISRFQIGYEITKGLTLRSNLGYNTLTGNEYNANPKLAQDPLSYPYTIANFGTNDFKTWIIEPQMEYKRSLGKGRLDILFGGTFQQNTNNKTIISGENYSNDLLINSITGAGVTYAVGNYNLYKYNAFFGRINYILDNKYIVDLTGRRDGSSRFGPGKQFGNFGSVGGGWLFSEESFIRNSLPIISYGKLRASYGTTGNDNIGDYQYLSAYTPIPGVAYQGSPGYNPQGLYNPNFSWALTKKLEAGLELGLFKDRILAGVSWYRNRSGNQLVTYTLPLQVGFGSVLRNAPYTVQNMGWEISVSSTNIKTGKFTWNTAFNITIPKNILLSFPGLAQSPYQASYVVGKSLSVLQKVRYFNVNDTTGVFQFLTAKGIPTYFPSYSPAATGAGDAVIIGNRDPKFYGGIKNTFKYGGVQLDVFLQFSKQMGPNYLGQVYLVGYPAGANINLPASFVSHWQKETDQSNIQKFSTQFADAYKAGIYFSQSSAAYGDASFIRVKTVSLAYNFTTNYLRKMNLEGLSLYVNAQNLFTITGYKGNDPENQSFYSLPPLRTFVAGIQLNF